MKRKAGRPTALELKPGASGKFSPRRFPPAAPPKPKPAELAKRKKKGG